ncbi:MULTISPECIES: enoyl-CoA hydratase/isomerase family protein [unclassified Caulobacter]|uniref:enoyl-CoA hydratase/isomerase family protein n=1 Tax=unclassified Caulobacter TaxID=2648921 RepID=UPI0006F1F2C3|nr:MULTISPECIES: enoyl-CoA hydratase/isomerase family protein [unclassified Caulobacter]KQV55766.1 enoyl-CoA hydratase [Caulobacter sp. Root342]KQV71061.1 enoyl-CoA hydratase [Caulobacter sp. Root343]
MIHLSHPEPSIALVELDVAPANVLAMAARARLLEAFAAIEADRAVRAVVLTGRNGAFCTGDDLAESLSRDVETQSAAILHFLAMVDRVAACRAPVIAAIDGWCVGGGLELALACDIRLASERASFACSAVRMGLTASAGRLVRLVGESRAKPHLLTGAPFDAARALADGMVAEVHPAAGLLEAALGMAHVIASRAPLAVEATKRVASGLSTTEAEAPALAATADHAEARAAFMAKRPAVFTGG